MKFRKSREPFCCSDFLAINVEESIPTEIPSCGYVHPRIFFNKVRSVNIVNYLEIYSKSLYHVW